MKPLLSGICAFAFAALLGATGAQAFTITSNNGGSSDGSAQFGDPPKINNDPIQHFSTSTDPDGSQRSTFKFGNSSLSLGFGGGGGWGNGAYGRNNDTGYNAMTGRQLFGQ